MGDLQAKMFNKKAANPKNKPDQILDALDLRSGQLIADIGSGGGYFSLRFAETVGKTGKVYAVDENQEYLDFIRRNAEDKNLHNVILVRALKGGMSLPGQALDLVFMRNVTHHINDRIAYFKLLRKHLKSHGRVAIIEYRPSRAFSFRGLFGHHVSREVIAREMSEAGYVLEREFDFLPEQHFSIFKAAG
jgi:arsenite methyltransferase